MQFVTTCAVENRANARHAVVVVVNAFERNDGGTAAKENECVVLQCETGSFHFGLAHHLE